MGDKSTRKMEADELRALMQQGTRGPRAPTMRVDNELLDELVARSAATDADDDDLAIPVAATKSQPLPQAVVVEEEPHAVIVEEPARASTRHARAIAPITKPPVLREPTRPPAPSSVSRAGIAIAVVVLALAAGLAVVLELVR